MNGMVGEIKKNQNEKLRVQVAAFKGTTFLDARIYYEDSEGEWKPSKKGITIKKEDVDQFITFLEEGKKKL